MSSKLPSQDDLRQNLQGLGKRFGTLMSKGIAAVYEAGAYRFVGNQIMLITTTGRKTGRRYTTPVGYVKTGEYLYAITRGGAEASNWIRNVQKNPEVKLQIGDNVMSATGEVLEDPTEVRQVIKLFLKQRPGYERFLNVSLNSSEAEMEQVSKKWLAARFQVKKATQGTK